MPKQYCQPPLLLFFQRKIKVLVLRPPATSVGYPPGRPKIATFKEELKQESVIKKSALNRPQPSTLFSYNNLNLNIPAL